MRNTGAAFGGRTIGSVFLIIVYHKDLWIFLVYSIYIYIYINIYIPQTVLALRGSYLLCIVIAHDSRKSECQPRYLSPAANSLDSRIAECQPRYLSLGT